jgi:hypothetical protein
MSVHLFRNRAIEDAVTDCRFEPAGLRKSIPAPDRVEGAGNYVFCGGNSKWK